MWRWRFRPWMLAFEPAGSRSRIGGSEIEGRSIHRTCARKSQRRQAIHRDETLKRHVRTTPFAIGRCVVGLHPVLGHGLLHFRAFRHLDGLALRSSRLCRNLDEKSEAETYHGQDAHQFHRIRLVRQASKRKALTFWRVCFPSRTAFRQQRPSGGAAYSGIGKIPAEITRPAAFAAASDVWLSCPCDENLRVPADQELRAVGFDQTSCLGQNSPER